MRKPFRVLLSLFAALVVFAPSAASACPSEGALAPTPTSSSTAPAAGSYIDGTLTAEYTYQLEDLVSTTVDNWVDEGRYVWKSNWVDEGRYVWQSNWVDRGSWVWTSNWVDEGYTVQRGYWEGALETSTTWTWKSSGHWAWDTHRNKYSAWGAVWYNDCAVHAHDSVEGDCGGHATYYVTHWNTGKFWHDTSKWVSTTTTTWNAYARWVDTSYWQSNWVDRGSWSWSSRWVDEGRYVWQSNWVDRGSWVWSPNLVNRPITTSTWVARDVVTTSTPPVTSSVVRVRGSVSTMYFYDVLVETCSSPT